MRGSRLTLRLTQVRSVDAESPLKSIATSRERPAAIRVLPDCVLKEEEWNCTSRRAPFVMTGLERRWSRQHNWGSKAKAMVQRPKSLEPVQMSVPPSSVRTQVHRLPNCCRNWWHACDKHRAQLLEEWAGRITEARLLTVMTKEEIFAEATPVYNAYVEALATAKTHVAISLASPSLRQLGAS